MPDVTLDNKKGYRTDFVPFEMHREESSVHDISVNWPIPTRFEQIRGNSPFPLPPSGGYPSIYGKQGTRSYRDEHMPRALVFRALVGSHGDPVSQHERY
jgi:hypothetical protein